MSVVIPTQWDRWIYSSVVKHFNARRAGIHMFVEGFDRDTAGKIEFLDLRIDGPFYDETSNGEFTVKCEINVLCTVVETANAYRVHEVTGIIAAAFTNCIALLKLGDPVRDAANTGLEFGTLKQQVDKKEKIIKSFFGKIRPDTEIIQASVEGHYRTSLSTN